MEEITMEQKAIILGDLLATTSFPPKVVQKILDNLDKITDTEMDLLIESLTNERSRLSKMAVMMADFAEYVDYKLDGQTSESLKEIGVLSASQNELMDKDIDELKDIVNASQKSQV